MAASWLWEAGALESDWVILRSWGDSTPAVCLRRVRCPRAQSARGQLHRPAALPPGAFCDFRCTAVLDERSPLNQCSSPLESYNSHARPLVLRSALGRGIVGVDIVGVDLAEDLIGQAAVPGFCQVFLQKCDRLGPAGLQNVTERYSERGSTR